MICGEAEDFEKAGLRPQDLSTGVLVGAVEKVGYAGKPAAYDESHLANPRSDYRSHSNLRGTRSRSGFARFKRPCQVFQLCSQQHSR
jgi:hypothetical protein